MAAPAGGRTLYQTPTWAVAAVVAIIIGISLLLEKFLHKVGHWFSKKKKASMVEVLEKVKAELMILGFISLLLTFGQNYIARICIPEKVADTMLPCKLKEKSAEDKGADAGKHRRLLMWEDDDMMFPDFSSKRRFLAAPVGNTCDEGKVPFVSPAGIHELHIFIFFLAVFHVLTTAITMGLGRAKTRGWKDWERETESMDYKFSSDPSRFNVVEENSFVQQHVSCWNRVTVLLYISSFFRQFFRSVRKVDYLTIRHGFISTHLAPGRKFDFQKYIKRSLEDDFKVVVGISLPLWASGVLLLLLDIEGLQIMFWISLLPLVILLAVGTKLQAIITQMAIEIHDSHVVVQGMPQVKLNDRYFWFKKPQFVLYLIHFTLFQNAFQLIYFLWIWYMFGINSCYHNNKQLLIARICLGVFVQFLCSYVTLPLYALVSQLGSHMKTTIFDEHTSQALKKWHENAKKHHGRGPETRTPSASPGGGSPLHSFHRYKSIPNISARGVAAREGYRESPELSSIEIEAPYPEATVTRPRSLNGDVEMGAATVEGDGRDGREDFSFSNARSAQRAPKLM